MVERNLAKVEAVSSNLTSRSIYSRIAQLVEQMTVNHWVPGSSPGSGAILGLVVQLVRITACHAVGHGFESRPDRQIRSILWKF